MDYSDIIVKLYTTVFEKQKDIFNVKPNDITEAIGNMKDAYMPNRYWESENESKYADYNNPAHRCGYLHKYAMLHTGLVCKVLQTALRKPDIYRDIDSKRKLNLCSLGGGPGSDMVALLFVVKEVFGFIQCTANVVDYALHWQCVFESIVSVLRMNQYGSVNELVTSRYLSYDYLSADLLTLPWNTCKVSQAVANADIISMVKFISAAACNKTRQMVKKIFQTMKPGAMLLFVDNASGGFDRMLQEAAGECGMQSVFGPVNHYDFEEPSFSRNLYGYTSQSKTKVVIEIWKKPTASGDYTSIQLQQEYMYDPESSLKRANADNVILIDRPRDGESKDSGCCSII